MESSRRPLNLITFVFALLIVPVVAGSVLAQGGTRGSGLDLAPSNPFGMPGTTAGLPQGSNSLYLNSGMFRDIIGPISNLEIGYLYQFGNKIRTGRLTLDYVLPATVWDSQGVFAEAHGEFTNFWQTIQRLFSHSSTDYWNQGGMDYTRSMTLTRSESGYPERIDLSFGGGYRKLLSDTLMLGVNAFYDTTKLGSRWYGSGGLGFEMATLGAGNDLVELTFNYYGDIFQGRNSIVNAFRNGAGNFDVEIGYSHELGEGGPDLRLKLTGYQFDVGSKIYGWNGGAEITSRNGMFSVKAEAGRDEINGTYYTIGGFANVGLQLANLVRGESPFTAPEPIFQSPRNLRKVLTQKVRRNWHQPATVVVARSRSGQGQGPGDGCIRSGYFVTNSNLTFFFAPIDASELPVPITSITLHIDFVSVIPPGSTLTPVLRFDVIPWCPVLFTASTAGNPYDGDTTDIANFETNYNNGRKAASIWIVWVGANPLRGSYCLTIE